jgi:hypothetical protein
VFSTERGRATVTDLAALARWIANAYVARSHPRAVLLVGSAATGAVDEYSDVDMIAYYEAVPAQDDLAAARAEIGVEEAQVTPWSDDQEPAGYGERYFAKGIEIQVGHSTIAAWERQIDEVIVGLELKPERFKMLSGLYEGAPLYGAEFVERWRERARYTDALRRAVIERHWQFFPWWYYEERLRTRDATIWRYDVLVQASYNLVAVLAALNGVYFSTFEFKREREFFSRLQVAPRDLAARLHALFELGEREATAELERLVGETQALVAARFPDLDLTIRWGIWSTPPGARETPWTVRAATDRSPVDDA